MAYHLQPTEYLRSPNYWDGIDISDASVFDIPQPDFELMPHPQIKDAQDSLISCAADIEKGHYQEIDIPADSSTTHQSTKYPAGSVVILDTEQLWHVEGTNYLLPPNTDARIEEPFVPYWLEGHGSDSFGQEIASFSDEIQFYLRGLSWGVLLSGSSDEQLMKLWQFSDLRLTDKGPRLRVGAADDMTYRLVGRASLSDRTAQSNIYDLSPDKDNKSSCSRLPSRNSRLSSEPQAFVRIITRLRGAKIIEHANGQLPDVPDISVLLGLDRPLQHA